LGFFFLYVAAIALEAIVLVGAVFVAPFFLAKTGRLRWALRATVLVLWLCIFHGKELAGNWLITLQTSPSRVLSANGAYCDNINLVAPGYTPVSYDGPDAVEGRVWQFRPPYQFIDTVGECGPTCATWLRSGLVNQVYVGTPDTFRVAYPNDVPAGLRHVSIVPTAQCDAMIEGTIRRRSLEDYLSRATRPDPELPRWNDACFVYEPASPAQPLIVSVHTIEISEIGFGLSRIEFSTALEEHVTGEVLADSHMTMIRGVTPTFQPFVSDQHVRKGALLDSFALMQSYRSANCPRD
jgi:hypothetical protein